MEGKSDKIHENKLIVYNSTRKKEIAFHKYITNEFSSVHERIFWENTERNIYSLLKISDKM